ncbi:acyltransferase family protein [Roseateles sp. BYS180W]|uniref:Acyltransferase family protein n=1 Tax=Roseateles rivi TaxID=3299028 RepID=A0ABW7FWI6_9BURK
MVSNTRFASVDALRGLAVAAMLLVNNPGSWSHVYAPLQHAPWHGFTLADLVFPLFLFIVGVSISLSMGGRIAAGAPKAPMSRNALVRAARIVVLGLVLHALAWWLMDKPEFRLMGVLQRIGLCFALVALAAIWLTVRQQWLLFAALLLGYGALLASAGDLSKSGNLASQLDSLILGRWNYEWHAQTGMGHEPEGLLSTLGALASTLLGVRAGDVLRRAQPAVLALMGGVCLAAGWWLAGYQPMNKQLWTPAFVLWCAGWSLLLLTAGHLLLDRLQLPPLGRAFGVNAIAAYAGAWVMAVVMYGFKWHEPAFEALRHALPSLPAPAQSLTFAMAFVLLWGGVAVLLDKRGIYIKV